MITIASLLELSNNAEYVGNFNQLVKQPKPLDESTSFDESTLSWCSIKMVDKLKDVTKGVVICPKEARPLPFELSRTVTYIFVDNPRLEFLRIIKKFFIPKQEYKIASSASIDSSIIMPINLDVGHNVVIEFGCLLGENIVIGANTVIKSNTIIKNNVIIGCNNTIGGVGFGYEKDEQGSYTLLPHLGNVIIEENVEIGNNTCIDRAVLGSTVLKNGCKIDNLVHIAHGVIVGENSLIIANSLIGGSTNIGRNVWVAPSATIINKISIGDNALIGMGAVVTKSVDPQVVVVGNPARELKR